MRFYLTVERVQTVSSTMDPHSSAQIYGDLRKQGTPNSRILIIRTPNKVPLIFGNSHLVLGSHSIAVGRLSLFPCLVVSYVAVAAVRTEFQPIGIFGASYQ